MKKLNRKEFLQLSSLASGSLFVPGFLKAMGTGGFLKNAAGEKVLIVIQLSGGNDGLNTFIPFRNDAYYNHRPALAYKENEILKVNDDVGFNPALTGLRDLYRDDKMCIVNEVGYPNPDHSHFRSMDIWTTASGSDKYIDTGWLGRYLDASCSNCDNAHMAVEVEDSLGLALKGKNIKGLALSNPERIYRSIQDPFFKQLVKQQKPSGEHHDQAAYLYKTMIETSSSVSYIYEKSKIYKSSENYPDNNFGKNLKSIAELICSGCETRVYYISLTGFDTHARQKPVHERLLGVLSQGLQSLVKDLEKNNKFDSTLIMGFSEFGRRVIQNASQGTDHGEANNVLLLSGSLKKKGFYNKMPDLLNLDAGNLKYQTDFRNIYSTILSKWLKADDQKILGEDFTKMNFI